MLDNAWWKDGNYTHKECIVCECRGQCMVNVMWMMRKQRTQRVKCKWNASEMQVKCKWNVSALNRSVNTNEYDLLILNGIGQHAGKTYLSLLSSHSVIIIKWIQTKIKNNF